MTARKAAFVLVRGTWHRPETWHALYAPLVEAGYAVYAPDLGHATDTQKSRTDHVLGIIREAHRMTALPVILVGHSLGGVTVSDIAEVEPQLLSAVIFVCAYMVPPGLTAGDIRRRASMGVSLVPTPPTAAPNAIGVLRIDVAGRDANDRRMRRAFAEGVDDLHDLEGERTLMHANEPLVSIEHRSTITRQRFGQPLRFYVRTRSDLALLPEAQNEMIREVDEAMGTATIVYDLETGHSPHLTMPRYLSEILLHVALITELLEKGRGHS